ncbi:MAG: hypothetical protein WBK77_10790 [Alphaproteobacteria bacterium]
MFRKETIEAVGLDWNDANQFNEYFSKLKKDQVEQIIVEGDLARSKLAWKITIYSQAMRYRLIELTEACIDEWDKDRFVGCFIMARAIIETVAVLYEFEHRLDKALSTKDLNVVDSLIMNRTFASRLADLFGNKKAYESLSVLTAIDKLDKKLEGHVRLAYDRLSEYAHTNYLGVSSSYAKIDYTYGDVSYGNQNTKYNVFMRLQGEFGLLELANMAFEKIKSHIKTTANFQAS